MAHIKVDFFSNALIRTVSFEMYIPSDRRTDLPQLYNPHYDRECKTIFVLHGYTGWGKGWDHLYELAEKYNYALVFPTAENSFYLDSEASGWKYGTFVGSELISYIRKTFGLCSTRENTYISGLSMGGFGALHTGFAYPEHFGKIIALSSALIVHDIAGMKPGEEDFIANYYYYRQCFGDLDRVVQSESNPEVLIQKLLREGKKIPDIYMACGTEDFLLETNRTFHKFLLEHKVKVKYLETAGNHDMTFWNEYFKQGFEWLLAAEAE